MYENPTISTARTLVFVSAILNLVFGILTALILYGIPLIVAGAIMLKYRDLPTQEFLSKRTTMLVWAIVFVVMGNWIVAALLFIAYGTTAQFENTAYYVQGFQGYGQPAYGPQAGGYSYPSQAYGQSGQYAPQPQAYPTQNPYEQAGQYGQPDQSAYGTPQGQYPAAQPNPYTQPQQPSPFSPENPSGQGGQPLQQAKRRQLLKGPTTGGIPSGRPLYYELIVNQSGRRTMVIRQR